MLNPLFDSRFETASVANAPGSGFQLVYNVHVLLQLCCTA